MLSTKWKISQRICVVADGFYVPVERRDRGLLRFQLDQYEGAITDLQYYIDTVPGGEGVQALGDLISRIQRLLDRPI